MKELTKAEEEIMHILWKLDKAFVHDIIDKIPGPKPAYNTVSTIVRILEKKGFVDHTAYGKTHQYFPVITKVQYSKGFLKGFVKDYFASSYKNMVSFFSSQEKLSAREIEEIIKVLESQLKTKQKGDSR